MFGYRFNKINLKDVLSIPVAIKKCRFYISANSGSLLTLNNYIVLARTSVMANSFPFEFPYKINSPCEFTVTYSNLEENAFLIVLIDELGGTPDPYYFDRDENGFTPKEVIQARQAARIVYPTRLTAKEVADLMNGGELSSVESTPRTHPTLEPKVTEDAQSTSAIVKTKTK